MTPYRFTVRDLRVEHDEVLNAIPGVWSERGRIRVPYNAGWLVEDMLTAWGLTCTISAPPPIRAPDWSQTQARLENSELHSWLWSEASPTAAEPVRLLPFQREAIAWADAVENGHLWQSPGCLAADTIVVVNRAGCARRMRIADVVARFNGARTRGKFWRTDVDTYVQGVDGENYGWKHRVTRAVVSGVKQVFRLRCGDNTIDATADHRFWTPQGWRALRQLSPGDQVYRIARPVKRALKAKLFYPGTGRMQLHPYAVHRASHAGARSSPASARKYVRATYPGMLEMLATTRNAAIARMYDVSSQCIADLRNRVEGTRRLKIVHSYDVPTHRLVAEARASGLAFDTFVARVRSGDHAGLVFLDRATHVHHIDHDTRNFAPENLQVMSARDHAQHHGVEGDWRNVAWRARVETITAIEPRGEVETFDLTVEGPDHNFCANDFVVHNSGKSLELLAWGLAEPRLPLVVVTRAIGRDVHRREALRFSSVKPLVLKNAKVDLAGYVAAHTDRIVLILSWEALPSRYEAILRAFPRGFSVGYDECFVGTAEVLTNTGWKQIKAIKVGDVVRSMNTATGKLTWRRVLRQMVNPRRVQLTEVRTTDGSLPPCTANHKIWTYEHGFIAAERLTDRHHLCSLQAGELQAVEGNLRLRMVRSDIRALPRAPKSQAVLQQVMCSTVAKYNTGGQAGMYSGRYGSRREESGAVHSLEQGAWISADAREQSDEIYRDAGEGFGGTQGIGIRPEGSRRKWDRPDTVGIRAACQAARGLATGRGGWRADCDQDEIQDAAVLQTGPRAQREEDSAGDRWSVTQHAACEGQGQTEGCGIARTRVVGHTDQEQGSVEFAGSGGATDTVYDLEVDVDHCYFVRTTAGHGVLVSNCHRAKNYKREHWIVGPDGEPLGIDNENITSAAAHLSDGATRRLGTTATPVRDRLRDLWGQLSLIDRKSWGRTISRFAERYCDAKQGEYGWDITGMCNVDELRKRMAFNVHTTPRSVTHGQLPAKRRQVMRLAAAQLDQSRGAVLDDGEAAGLRNARKASRVAGERGRAGRESLFESQLRDAASRKRTTVRALVKEHTGTGNGKVVVLTGRRADCALLGTTLGADTVWWAHGDDWGTSSDALTEDVLLRMIDGGSPRNAIADAYMQHPGPCVIAGTIDAWGESITLSDTDVLMLVMLPWTPGQVDQVEGRVSRLGQLRPVLVLYLLAEDTVDERVAVRLLSKLPAVEQVVGAGALAGLRSTLMGIEDIDAVLRSLANIFDEVD